MNIFAGILIIMGIFSFTWLCLKDIRTLKKDWKESKRKIDYEEEIRNFKN